MPGWHEPLGLLNATYVWLWLWFSVEVTGGGLCAAGWM
jgi:hypothetical protein